MKTIIFAGIIAAMLQACAGTSFTMDDARKVKIGMTEAEVTEIMGTPNAVKSQEGKEV